MSNKEILKLELFAFVTLVVMITTCFFVPPLAIVFTIPFIGMQIGFMIFLPFCKRDKP